MENLYIKCWGIEPSETILCCGTYVIRMGCYRNALVYCTGLSTTTRLSAFHAPVTVINNVNRNLGSICEVRHDGVSSPSWASCVPPYRQSLAAVPRDENVSTSSRRSSIYELQAGRSGDIEDEFYTPADLEAYSAPWGIELRYRSTLNSYRIEAFRSNGELAGYTTGFYLGDLLHLDKVQIQRKESAYEPGAPNAPTPGTRDLPWAAKTGNIFQLGAVLGCAAVRYGWDRGARRVELLAIRENERQHSRLVRYYRIAGFRSVREVGEDLGSFKDRLLWGAEGTLMVAEAADFMRRWTPLMLETSKSNSKDSAVPSIGDKQEA